jgi:hypothetical protein
MLGLSKLFNPRPSLPPKRYVDSGYKQTAVVVNELYLTDWSLGRPTTTAAENESFEKTLAKFASGSKALARQQGGEDIEYHPEFWERIQRVLLEFALTTYAHQEVRDGRWKNGISAYLKAWAANLNPWMLLYASQTLASQGYLSSARGLLDTAALYASYVRTKSQEEVAWNTAAYITAKSGGTVLLSYKDMSDIDFAEELQTGIAALRTETRKL